MFGKPCTGALLRWRGNLWSSLASCLALLSTVTPDFLVHHGFYRDVQSFLSAALDVAIVKIDADVYPTRLANVATALLGFTSVPWSSDDRASMMRMIHRPDDVTLREVGRVNRMIADRTADAVLVAISAAGLTRADVHLIASHGKLDSMSITAL